MEIKIIILPYDYSQEETEQDTRNEKERIWKIEQVGGEEIFTDPDGQVFRQKIRLPD